MQRTTKSKFFSSYKSTVSNKSGSGTARLLRQHRIKAVIFSICLKGMVELFIFFTEPGRIAFTNSHKTVPSWSHTPISSLAGFALPVTAVIHCTASDSSVGSRCSCIFFCSSASSPYRGPLEVFVLAEDATLETATGDAFAATTAGVAAAAAGALKTVVGGAAAGGAAAGAGGRTGGGGGLAGRAGGEDFTGLGLGLGAAAATTGISPGCDIDTRIKGMRYHSQQHNSISINLIIIMHAIRARIVNLPALHRRCKDPRIPGSS
jgi:hypothetical protein